MNKLRTKLARITPSGVLALSDSQLRSCGFSQQKTRYTRALAEAITDRSLHLPALVNLPAEDIRKQLLRLPGIGVWTADVYILMVLRHRDIWPTGDLALRLAMRELFADELQAGTTLPLTSRQEDEHHSIFAQRWQPWRGVAARICWLHYLRVRHR